jgi:hypothetical protein
MFIVADRGNTIVIRELIKISAMKILEFCNNNYTDIKGDNTNYFQRQIRNNLNNNFLMIRKDKKWRYVSLKPNKKNCGL